MAIFNNRCASVSFVLKNVAFGIMSYSTTWGHYCQNGIKILENFIDSNHNTSGVSPKDEDFPSRERGRREAANREDTPCVSTERFIIQSIETGFV